MIKAFGVAVLTLMLASASPGLLAQEAPAAPAAAAAVGVGGIQGQNIFEVKPDASALPGYAEQTNGQRAKVQPGNNAPMWRQVSQGVTGYSSLPKSQAPEAGNLIQPFVQYPGSRWTTAGEAWRQVRNQWIIPYGGALLLIVLGALALFYLAKGPLGHAANDPPGRIERFTPFERSAHWANAAAFTVLAVSGLVMAFGQFILLPFFGANLFGWLTYALKTAHNFAGPLFAVSLVVVFFTFLKDNFPNKGDLTWLVKAGGMLSKQEVPSHRFNAGEKLIFWGGVLLLGAIVVGSGLVMDQLVMAMFLGHIYIGTIGMRGAYKAMKTGYVDDAWAREHHLLWHADIQAGKIPAQRSEPEAPAGKTVQV